MPVERHTQARSVAAEQIPATGQVFTVAKMMDLGCFAGGA